MAKSFIRLTAVGLIVATSIASGPWFWLGVLVATLVMAGMAGAGGRPALPWMGGLTLLMWILLHVRAINPAIGWTILGVSGAAFVFQWMLGPGRLRMRLMRRRAATPTGRRRAV